MTNVLVICMGNICRSPMGQAVLEKLVAQAGLGARVKLDSAGTHANTAGERPDPRAVAALLRRGYEMGRQRSRRVSAQDFAKFDLILAMDLDNLSALKKLCPPEHVNKVQLFMHHAAGAGLSVASEVPDPYYGNPQGFERVLDLCEVGGRALVKHLQTLA